MDHQRTKRKSLCLEDKARLIQEVMSGRKHVDVAAEFGIPSSTLSTILKHKEMIFKAVDSGMMAQRKKIRATPYEDIEQALYSWMLEARVNNVPTSGAAIQQKAMDFAKSLGIEDFRASPGWMHRFKERHNLIRKGEEQCGSETKGRSFCKVLQRYEASDMYTADEMGLFFDMMPKETYALADQPCQAGQHSNKRITILFCTNMNGSDKRPPVVVGNSKLPRCFSGREQGSIKYCANGRSWMTRAIFAGWLKGLDNEMANQGRKICLFLRDCSAHQCWDLALSNVKLKFFPNSRKPVLRPFHQGIIGSIRRAYRRRLLERQLLNIQLGRDIKIDIFLAIEMLSAAWAGVESSTIADSFTSAGFSTRTVKVEGFADGEDLQRQSEDFRSLWKSLHECGAVPRDVGISDFLNADVEVVTTEELSVEEALDSLFGEDRTGDDNEDDDDDDDPLAEAPMLNEALDALSVLQRFAQYQGLQGALDPIAKLRTMFAPSSKLTQRKLTDYFSCQ